MGHGLLHLIKGRPCVHTDDDLIVSHIALVVADMPALKQRLTKMGDPDGYYIEFCNCSKLEDFLH